MFKFSLSTDKERSTLRDDPLCSSRTPAVVNESLVTHNIVRMLDCYAVEQTRAIYLVLEYCDGGDRHREQNDQRGARFSIPQARFDFVQVIKGLAYLHSKGIAHMDIKQLTLC